MKRTCPVCKNEYEDGGNVWKKVCHSCYVSYKHWKRIQPMGYKEDIYITHPSVTKEELEEYIREHKLEVGWGPQPIDPSSDFYRKWRIWTNSTNYD